MISGTVGPADHEGSLRQLVEHDFKHELLEELNLDIDFSDVTPLLFCRDIVRGGKLAYMIAKA